VTGYTAGTIKRSINGTQRAGQLLKKASTSSFPVSEIDIIFGVIDQSVGYAKLLHGSLLVSIDFDTKWAQSFISY